MKPAFFALLTAAALSPALALAETDAEKMDRVVASCQKLTEAIDKTGTPVDRLGLKATTVKNYRTCQRILQKHAEVAALQKKIEEKKASNAAKSAKRDELAFGNYKLGRDILIGLGAPGTRWSTEKECNLYVVLADNTVVELQPAGIDPEATALTDNDVLRIVPAAQDGVQRVVDRDFNTKPMAQFDYPLDAAKLRSADGATKSSIANSLKIALKSMARYCAAVS